jgi:hypothetical protein
LDESIWNQHHDTTDLFFRDQKNLEGLPEQKKGSPDNYQDCLFRFVKRVSGVLAWVQD